MTRVLSGAGFKLAPETVYIYMDIKNDFYRAIACTKIVLYMLKLSEIIVLRCVAENPKPYLVQCHVDLCFVYTSDSCHNLCRRVAYMHMHPVPFGTLRMVDSQCLCMSYRILFGKSKRIINNSLTVIKYKLFL